MLELCSCCVASLSKEGVMKHIIKVICTWVGQILSFNTARNFLYRNCYFLNTKNTQ